MDRGVTVIAGITVIVLALIIAIAVRGEKNYSPRTDCIEHSQSLAMHIHPVISINLDGQPVAIPANIGISSTCMSPVHTHDTSGTIHVEYTENHDFTLSDFFANWGQPFSKDQILDKKADATHEITMTVDGQPSTEFGNLVFKDKQQIIINYTTKK